MARKFLQIMYSIFKEKNNKIKALILNCKIKSSMIYFLTCQGKRNLLNLSVITFYVLISLIELTSGCVCKTEKSLNFSSETFTKIMQSL